MSAAAKEKAALICGIITAAGLSTRMNAFKPLLTIGGETLIERSAASLLDGAAQRVVIVIGHRGDEIRRLLSARFGKRVQFAVNSEYATSDMLASVKIGISALPDCDAFYLLPGDMPAVAAATFAALSRTRDENPQALAVFPCVDGRRCHPPLISRECIATILSFAGDGGLRALWRTNEERLSGVAVDDAGCLLDADTPEDYLQLQRYLDRVGRNGALTLSGGAM